MFCDRLAATPFGLYNNKSGRGRAPASEARSIVAQVQLETVVDTSRNKQPLPQKGHVFVSAALSDTLRGRELPNSENDFPRRVG